MSKETAKAAGVATSTETENKLATTGGQALALDAPVVDLGISQEARDKMAQALQKALHEVEVFGDLMTPGKIHASGELFFIVDGLNVDNFVDKKTGEIKSKCIFVLQFTDGRVVNMMQNSARPRAIYADAAEAARSCGLRYEAGPMRLTTKNVNNINDAFIFERLPGFQQRAY